MRKRRSIWRRAAKAALALGLAFCVAQGAAMPAVAETLSELQQQQKELEQQEEENRQKLDALKADQSKQQEYKDALDAQVQNLQSQIDALNAQIGELDASISEKDDAIAEKQRSIDSDIETLKERLCAIYMLGDASTLEIILQSESVIDMAQKVELLNMITEHDTKMIQQLAADMESIAAEKAEIESEKEQVSAARTELDSRRTDLAAVQAEADRVLRELTASVASVQEEQQKIAARKAAADQAVDDWLADYYAQQQAQQNGGSSGGGSSTGSGGYVSTGSFTWPCPGFTRITTQFNEWTYGGYHHGTDIASTGGRSIYGAPIVAADSGRVIRAGWDNSYGNCVYIDHGGGYVTRYAHASSLAVSYGQTVTKGQTIAYVGNTGDSFGAHLHFEVILNGVRQNPMNYFS